MALNWDLAPRFGGNYEKPLIDSIHSTNVSATYKKETVSLFSPFFRNDSFVVYFLTKTKSSLVDSKQMNCQEFFREKTTTMKCAFSCKEKLGILES